MRLQSFLTALHVITSYSIHYTKLYDRKLGKPTDQRMAILRSQVTALLENGSVKTTLHRRITSYNVCYTKLLR